MNYKYRVYNSLTGTEYADVDRYVTALLLIDGFVAYGANRDSFTIDALVAEAVA